MVDYTAACQDLREKQARVDLLDELKKKKRRGYSAGVYAVSNDYVPQK